MEELIYDIAISPDGKHIALASDKVYLWNIQTQELQSLEFEMISPIHKVTFSKDGTLLACSGTKPEGETVKIVLWNMAEMGLNTPLFEIETGAIPSKIVFSHDGTLVAFDDAEDIVVWDVQNVKPPIARISGHTSHIHSLDFTPDSKHIISTGHDNVIHIFNVRDEKETKLAGDTADVFDYAYAINNTMFIAACEDGSLYLWDIITGQSKKLLKMPDAG